MQNTSQHETLNIVQLIETNPKVNLSEISKNRLIEKLTLRFSDEEQKLFISNFYCYLNYDEKDYIINLEKIWKWLGFSRIDACKTVLKKGFVKDIDYKIALHSPMKPKNEGGHNKETILMNIDTFKKLCLKSNTKRADQIHNYYVNLEKVLNEILYEETTELRMLLEDAQTKLERYEKRPSTFGFDYIANKKGCVYLIRDLSKPGHYKIGMANDADKRLRNLNTSSSEKTLRIVYKLDTYHAELLEKTIQSVLQPFNIRGRREWFYFFDDRELNYAVDVFNHSHEFLEKFNIQSQCEFLEKTRDLQIHLSTNVKNDTDNTNINETNVYKLTAQNITNRTGRYKGVCWCLEKEKWKAELKKDYVTHFLGYYDNDTDAAKAYNNYAMYLNTTYNSNYTLNQINEDDYEPIPENIPELNRQKIIQDKSSQYRGVFYCESRKTYYASIKYMHKSYYLGANDDDEIECAKMYNKQAAYFNQIDSTANYILNEEFDKTPENIIKKRIETFREKKSSQYYGVTWAKQNAKWKAVIVVDKKQRHLGFFDNELDAAVAYNLYATQQNRLKEQSGEKALWKINNLEQNVY